ncbi:MAG: AsnC family transcriptional regulator [Actinobacteria bacterium]|nr:AsnC family transcriptional regulator [Actinomycetota bacterium]|tara:strand:+ start:110 stop:649 length:540 start_codon:yes stop_codon:yes gene_type:complete
MAKKIKIDEHDQTILKMLQSNGRVPHTEIATEVEMAPSAILERVRKLEKSGVIKNYYCKVDPKKVELNLSCFVFLKTNSATWTPEIIKKLESISNIYEIHEVSGEHSYLIKLFAKDTEDLSTILREQIGSIKEITETQTTIVLNTNKENSPLPIDLINAVRGKKRRGAPRRKPLPAKTR